MTTYKVNCTCCSAEFIARRSDLDRGWARHCSKSCAAIMKTVTLKVLREKNKIFDDQLFEIYILGKPNDRAND